MGVGTMFRSLPTAISWHREYALETFMRGNICILLRGYSNIGLSGFEQCLDPPFKSIPISLVCVFIQHFHPSLHAL